MLKIINELNDRKIAFKTGLGGKELSAFRGGGKAAFTAYPESVKALKDLCGIASAYEIEPFPFGLGSNVLILDGGFDGIMVSTVGLRRIELDGTTLTLSSGVPMTKIAEIAAKYELSGAEELCGIPATIGGMLKTNAGAFGKEIAEIVAEATVCDTKTGNMSVLKGNEIPFSYRSSGDAFRDKIIIYVKLKLCRGKNVGAKAEYFRNMRREYQPSLPSLGCTFKRTGEGISAGYYIDKSGLKGTRIGKAEISSKHAGFIVNRGGANASDYVKLMALASDAVRRKYGIELTPEIEIIGKENDPGESER